MGFNVEAEGTQKTEPYYMEGWINGFRFKTRIDMGSALIIFAVDEIKKGDHVQKGPSQNNDRRGEICRLQL